MATTNDDDRILTRKEAAAYLRCGLTTLAKLTSAGRLAAVRYDGHKVRYRLRTLRQFLLSHETKPA